MEEGNKLKSEVLQREYSQDLNLSPPIPLPCAVAVGAEQCHWECACRGAEMGTGPAAVAFAKPPV